MGVRARCRSLRVTINDVSQDWGAGQEQDPCQVKHYAVCTMAGGSSPIVGAGAVDNESHLQQVVFATDASDGADLKCMWHICSDIYVACAWFMQLVQTSLRPSFLVPL